MLYSAEFATGSLMNWKNAERCKEDPRTMPCESNDCLCQQSPVFASITDKERLPMQCTQQRTSNEYFCFRDLYLPFYFLQESLLVPVSDKTFVMGCWIDHNFSGKGPRHHSLVVVDVAIRAAAPRSLYGLLSKVSGVIQKLMLTTFHVNSAMILIIPCANPKYIETGKKMISHGLRRNRPIRLTIFENRYHTTRTTQPELRVVSFQVAEANQYATNRNGSVARPSEVNVAT
jgi:hypothetical protein